MQNLKFIKKHSKNNHSKNLFWIRFYSTIICDAICLTMTEGTPMSKLLALRVWIIYWYKAM